MFESLPQEDKEKLSELSFVLNTIEGIKKLCLEGQRNNDKVPDWMLSYIENAEELAVNLWVSSLTPKETLTLAGVFPREDRDLLEDEEVLDEIRALLN